MQSAKILKIIGLRLLMYIYNKRLGTDLVTLSIKHSAIVVEPFLIEPDLAIDGYRLY